MLKLTETLLILTLALLQYEMIAQSKTRISLNKDWHFQPVFAALTPNPNDVGEGLKTEGYTTHFPNTVLNALHENGVIEDPFYRDNEKRLQWLERKDWIFEKTFDVTPEVLKANHAVLILNGLDTYADVYLNDALVVKGNNMFLTYQKDVRNFLKPTGNVLKIYFFSPVVKDKARADNSFVDFPAIPENTRIFSRKAGFHYGWDWGPRLVTCGLQDIGLETWSDLKISDVVFRKQSVSSKSAMINAHLTIISEKDINSKVEITFGSVVKTEELLLSNGENEIDIDLNIPNPELWWTHNLGKPHLYDVKIKAHTEGGSSDEKSVKYGIRTIELVKEKEPKGESFFFRLNGKPIFAKGANLIPLHFFQEKVSPELLENTLQNAVDANMNMLRVWGGGIYQSDDFYQKCDEKGLLIWQDFMFACAMYPGDDIFLDNVREEATQQVMRLRNHACIALWCGNNEINEAWHNWGWQPRFNPDQKEFIWKAYTDLFQNLLPEIVKQYAPETAYHESSPRYGRYDKRSYTEGDNHDWFVWHDEKPFEHYEQKIPRFMSEYGFQSLPDWRTVQSFTKPEDLFLESDVMNAHQKHPRGNVLMKKYMERDYPRPRNFEDFVYVSQLVQADGISRAIAAQRRAMPYCMGSLYWQLNDVWQSVSWSSVDNFGRWKALQYAARDAFDNILVSPIITKDSVFIHIVNDNLDVLEGELFIYVMDFEGRVNVMEGRGKIILGQSSELVYQNTVKTMLKDQKPEDVFLSVGFKPKDKMLINKTAYFVAPKRLNLPSKGQVIKEILRVKDGYNIRLRSNVFLKNAYFTTSVEGSFDKNYIDILPSQDYVIHFRTKAEMSDVLDNLQIKSLVDVFRTP